MSAKVGYMQKISLSLETASAPDAQGVTEPVSTIEFVYGLAASGLTPFEFALAEKTVGDVISLQLPRDRVPAFFGHIRIPALCAAGQLDPIEVKARVLAISPPGNREVVAALAEIANCGDSCCGHHGPEDGESAGQTGSDQPPPEGANDENCR